MCDNLAVSIHKINFTQKLRFLHDSHLMKGFIIKNRFHKKIFANLCWIPHILIEFLSLTNSLSDFFKIIKDGGFYKTFKNFFAAIQYCKLATNLPLFNRFFVGLRKPPLLLVFFSKIRAKMHFHSSKMCIFLCCQLKMVIWNFVC